MKRQLRWGAGALVVGLVTLGGCANVKVHKVDVQDRVTGCDDKVKGFRYYLTRPYLMVSQRVPVSMTYIPVALAVFPGDLEKGTRQALRPGADLFLVAQVPDAQGTYRVYDSKGHPRPDLVPAALFVLPREGGGGQPPPSAPSEKIDLVGKLNQAIQQRISLLAIAAATKQGSAWLREDNGSLLTAIGAAANDLNLDYGKGLANLSTAKEWITAINKGIETAATAANRLLDARKKGVHLDPLPDNLANEIYASIVQPALGATGQPAPSSTPAQATAALATRGATTPTPSPSPTNGSNNTPSPPPPAPSSFQVVFLPDFEEQYAIQNCNFLAKTNYKYTFRNGTDLVTFSGAYDSTDVPLQIIETVGALIQAVGEVAKTRLGAAPAAGTAKAGLLAFTDTAPAADFYIRVERAIEPGVYRIQKSWERAAATPVEGLSQDQLCGLFADIGLPVVESISVVTDDQKTKNPLPSYPPPSAPAPAPGQK